MDVTHTLAAKSDQLNADDLVGGPVVVKIMGVNIVNGDQPVVIQIATADRKLQPWKPCLTMRRLLTKMWGKNATKWVGNFVKLYSDPEVKWAGKKTGGIRIAAATVSEPIEISLAVSKGKKQLYKVGILKMEDKS